MKRVAFARMLMVATLSLGFSTAAQRKLVEDVEIRGYRTVPVEEIRKRIKTQPGDEYKPKQAQRDFKSVLEMKDFDASKSKLIVELGPRGGIIVIFDLKETPKNR